MNVCPRCGGSPLVLYLETMMGFETDDNGVPTKIIRDEQNIKDGEEIRPDFQQSAEFHCRQCYSSFHADIVGPHERYVVGKQV